MNDEEIEKIFSQMICVIDNLQNRVAQLEKENEALIKSNSSLIDWIQMQEDDITRLQRNVKYEILDPRNINIEYEIPEIEDIENTLDLIVNEHKSLSRFGDGEFATIAGRIRHKFQSEVDIELGNRLREVLQAKEKNLLVALADNYGTLGDYKEKMQREIRAHLSEDERKFEIELLNKEYKYHNAYISRPYAMYKDQNTEAPARRFEALRRIWDKRECVFVEGRLTRLGVGNDLFSNASSIVRILGPEENAFRKYSEILNACRSMPKDKLFLLALGPTATVLAYDLCREGYQAVDIGHLDLEYEWFLQGTGGRTPVAYKYNNECKNGEQVDEISDEWYEKQIVWKCLEEHT